jgi:hypothetical protein
MYQILCVLAATIVYGTATGHCPGPQPGATAITFQSSTYSDMRQLLAREAASGTVTVQASLGFPEQARDRYPAVVIVHTIAGYRDANEGYVATELRKSGFATLTYDSFAARGTSGASLQKTPSYLPVGVADAYAALRRLASEPRIDPDRIAIIGFSFGGEIAHMTAFETLRSALNPGPGRFCGARRVLSRRKLWRVRRARRLYRVSGADAARRERRQSTGRKNRELPGLRARRRKSGPDRNRDLPGRLPCLDGS